MKKFSFRLERVLEYRRTLEAEAKDRFLEARTKTLEAELECEKTGEARAHLLAMPTLTVTDRKSLEFHLEALDDQERGNLAIISVLRDEEATLIEAWKETRMNVKALENLREEAVVEWTTAVARVEQSELDEWATQRREIA